MEENERKPVFTNTYGPSETTFREIYRYARRPMRIILIVLLVCIGVYVAHHLYQWIRWAVYYNESIFSQTGVWMLLAELGVMAFLIVWEANGAKRYAKRQLRRIKESYGTDDPRVHASFYDGEVEFHNDATNSTSRMAYDKFATCKETKDLFLIVTREKQFLLFPKDTFDGTDIVGFRAFMDEKCPNTKRKWRKAD